MMPLPEVKKRKTILVIGETGVGKSSLVNLITGRNVAKVSSSVLKGTFHVQDYTHADFRLMDTVGYNDVTEKPGEAFKNLAKFVGKVLTDGISLIVYVMKMGKVTATSKKNYDYFVKTVCMNKVPVLLVVTHCELEEDAQKWYHEEEVAFKEHGMNFDDVVCGCAIDLADPSVKTSLIPFLRKERENTKTKVIKMMEILALEDAWKPKNKNEWVVAVFVGTAVFGLTLAVLTLVLPELALTLGTGVVALLSKIRL